MGTIELTSGIINPSNKAFIVALDDGIGDTLTSGFLANTAPKISDKQGIAAI